VLIDLKIGKLRHQDLGQMQMYVNYFDREVRSKDEERTIDIILCHDKKETIARYTLPENNTQIFASKYKLYLPTEDELIREVDEVAKKLEGVE
jgi:YhcG PDDEXK nuclease domain